MQKKKEGKSNCVPLLVGAMLIAAIIGLAGCPGGASDNPGPIGPVVTVAPEKPQIFGVQAGTAFKNAADVTNPPTVAAGAADITATVAFAWTGEGAVSYNLYWNTENAQPTTPGVNTKEKSYIIDGLALDTDYYFWVEAVNPIGTTLSDPVSRKTVAANVERGDYPRNMRIIPGNGSLTVTWNMPDRVGWHEIYYAKAGAINHVDAYTPTTFPKTAGSPWENQVYAGDRQLYPHLTPMTGETWAGYVIGKIDGSYGEANRPVLGVDSFGTAGNSPTYPQQGAFYRIMEAWLEGDAANYLGKLQPYQKLDAAFANATPWNGAANGTPGTPIPYKHNSVTITGLTNGETYEVWVRVPNTNGERGYGYVQGIPGGAGAALAAPASVTVTTPAETTRNLSVTWSAVSGADGYRIYASKFPYTPDAAAGFAAVSGNASKTYALEGLDSGTTYYVWVVAEKEGSAGPFGNPVTGKTGTALATGSGFTKKIAGTNHEVKTAVYVEVNEHNPLNAGAYILEDGTYLFDYVILFAANIRNRNCAIDGEDHGCTESGPHVHLNKQVRYILDNRAQYIKPLQDKGIKVLLGLLGDHDGISFATMNDTDRATFITSLKGVMDSYGLDGFDFDDEWASKEDWNMNDGKNPNGTTRDSLSASSIWPYPISEWGWPYTMTVYRDPSKGVVAGNGTLTSPSDADMNRMWKELGANYYKTIQAARDAMPDKIISLYEYNTGRYITENGNANETATTDKLSAAIDFTLQPWYNQYINESANNLPRSKYAPFGIDIGGHAYTSFNGAAYPPIAIGNDEQATNTIYDYATRFKKAATDGNPYNMLYFYALEPSSLLVKRQATDATATVTREDYISHMTEIVFGQKTVLTSESADHRPAW